MIKYKTTILKFGKQGEKTGWTYIIVPSEQAQKLKPGNKKSFRVKGKLDKHSIAGVALIPMGEGDFIMPLNAGIRKSIGKRMGAELMVQIEVDEAPVLPSADLIACLKDEPAGLDFFYKMPKSHQNYFTKWIESAKTDATKAKRIAQAVNAMVKGYNFGEMVRALKAAKN